jgi:hypothetical protein
MVAVFEAFEKAAEGLRALSSGGRSARKDFLMGQVRDSLASYYMLEYEPLATLVQHYSNENTIKNFIIDTIKVGTAKVPNETRADFILDLSDLASENDDFFAEELASLGSDCVLAFVKVNMNASPKYYNSLYGMNGMSGQQNSMEEIFRVFAIQEISMRIRAHNDEARFVLMETVHKIASGEITYATPQPHVATVIPFPSHRVG